jgi:hypothetical protein
VCNVTAKVIPVITRRLDPFQNHSIPEKHDVKALQKTAILGSAYLLREKKAVKYAHHTNSSNWETLVSRRKLSRLCALYKAYSGERAWKASGDRMKRPHYLSRVDHEQKIRL